MGVECDGATYHSSRSARDRDRLRQEVLEGLGWTLYRVWSTDWFRNPVAEAERLREAIEAQLELASKKKIPERYGTEPVSRDDVTASEGEGGGAQRRNAPGTSQSTGCCSGCRAGRLRRSEPEIQF